MDRKISFGIPTAALLTILVANFLFATWFASMQLKVISVYAFNSYPLPYFMLTVIKSMLVVLAIFSINHALIRYLTYYELSSTVIAASYLALGFAWLKIPILYLATVILVIQLIGCYLTAHIRTYFNDGIAAVVLILLFLLLSNEFSPLHFNPLILNSHGFYAESIPVFTTIYHQFIWAKLFSFTQLNYASWANTLHAVNLASSPLMQILGFVLNIPSLNINGFHQLTASIFFFLISLGAFGFYLVQFYIFKIRKLTAILVSYLFFFAISPWLAQAFVSNGSLLISPIATLPYAILFMHFALKNTNFKLATFAGLALSAQYFFLSPYLRDTFIILLLFFCYFLAACCIQTAIGLFKKMQLLAVSLGIFVLLSAHQLWPLVLHPHTYYFQTKQTQLIERKKLADDLKDCPYYLSLHTVLSNYPGLNADSANTGFIKSKLIQFEKNLIASTLPAAISYQTAYVAQLHFWHIKSVHDLAKGSDVVNFANGIYPLIDSFYLNPALNCMNRRMLPKNDKTFRTIQYNFGSLYDKIENRFSRIQIFLPQIIQLGSFPGYFINNNPIGADIEKQVGEPLVTALYVLPINAALEQLSEPHTFTPQLRKLLDIGGIDIFTLRKHDLRSNEHAVLNNTVPIPTYLSPLFAHQLQNYKNLNSDGIAYFANHIYPPTADVKNAEAAIAIALKKGLAPSVDIFNQQLMQLKHKHDVILEGRAQVDGVNNQEKSLGDIMISNIIGDRALFHANCPKAHCVFVYNLTDSSDWHAFIDKQSVEIMRANFAFMAIPMTQGQHAVWFIHQSWSGLSGYLISILTLIIICCLRAEQHEYSDEAEHSRSEEEEFKGISRN